MDVKEKQWIIAPPAPADWQKQFSELPPFLRQLLWNRGIKTQKEIDEFLNPDYSKDLHDPFLFKDMTKATERIFAAIEKKEKIAVYGDYDADGVTGAVILETTLKALGAKISEVHLPHREKEGYGLNKEAVKHLITLGSKLIITCDCGIANFEEVKMAQEQGTDVIITDHHHVPQNIPPAYAILHPLLPDSGYPFVYLTGGGVAYKLACALVLSSKLKMQNVKLKDGFEKWLLDLVAISTIADVGKLIGENRTLVKYGLIVLRKTQRLGLIKLYEAAKVNQNSIDAWSVAFQITPRINAAGRMNHATVAYRLLACDDEAKAAELAQELNKTNQERQKETDKIVTEAKKQIDEEGKFFLSAYSEDWTPGVIGLAAGKIADEYHRPVVLATKNNEGMIMGSARSIDQFDIIQAMADLADLFDRFGGHPKAAGFTLKDAAGWKNFQERMEALAKDRLKDLDLRSSLSIDAQVTLPEISWDLWQAVADMEPFGEKNPRPRFLAENLKVLALETVGNGDKHLRLSVTDETRVPRKMIGFCFGHWCEHLSVGDKIDVVFEVGVHEWNGNRELEMKVVDLKSRNT